MWYVKMTQCQTTVVQYLDSTNDKLHVITVS